jgi:microsomal dipeptidase-like Zn-dependent dipeptidase
LSHFAHPPIVERAVDLSHSGETTTLEAIAFSRRLVCISHANLNFFHANVRNKSGWYRNPADFGNLTAGLLACGLSSKEVAKIMGGNWLRFMCEGFQPSAG